MRRARRARRATGGRVEARLDAASRGDDASTSARSRSSTQPACAACSLARQRCAERGETLVLRRSSTAVRRLLRLAGVSSLFASPVEGDAADRATTVPSRALDADRSLDQDAAQTAPLRRDRRRLAHDAVGRRVHGEDERHVVAGQPERRRQAQDTGEGAGAAVERDEAGARQREARRGAPDLASCGRSGSSVPLTRQAQRRARRRRVAGRAGDDEGAAAARRLRRSARRRWSATPGRGRRPPGRGRSSGARRRRTAATRPSTPARTTPRRARRGSCRCSRTAATSSALTCHSVTPVTWAANDRRRQGVVEVADLAVEQVAVAVRADELVDQVDVARRPRAS